MHKPVILFVMHELNVGGAERVVSNLVNNIDHEAFEVHLCLFKKKGALVETIAREVIIHDLEASRVLLSPHKLWSLILKLKPKVVFSSITHVNLLLSMLAPLLRPFLKETLFITREVNIPSIRAKYMPQSKKMDRFYKHTIGNFDYVIAQSNYMRDDLITHYGLKKEKVEVINNPLNVNFILSQLEKKTSKTLLNSTKINILATGNLRKQKGFDKLVEVMRYLDDRYHLTIIGEGVERALIEANIETFDVRERVTLLGFQANPYIYMKASDIVVLSSNYEGFPNVILEANACGKFAVAYRCPGVSEEIIQHEVNGSLVEFSDIKALAKSIENHTAIRHNEIAIKETTKQYEVQNIVHRYEEIFMKKEA